MEACVVGRAEYWEGRMKDVRWRAAGKIEEDEGEEGSIEEDGGGGRKDMKMEGEEGRIEEDGGARKE
jgi:hypothetical protein